MNTINALILLLIYWPHLLMWQMSRNKSIINEDKAAFVDGLNIPNKGLSLKLIFLKDKYARKIFYYRIGRISKIVSWYLPGESTLLFDSKVNIAGGIYAPHAFATIIHAKKVGKNFSFRQCTTIGNKKNGCNNDIPTIGDNVTLGANVVIIGNLKIGDNVIVGAGSVVVKDVPDNSIVVGNPARVLNKSN